MGFATAQNGSETIQNAAIRDEILWLFSFIGGFSDRFFEVMIERVKLVAIREKDDKRTLQELLDEIKTTEQPTTPTAAPVKENELMSIIQEAAETKP